MAAGQNEPGKQPSVIVARKPPQRTQDGLKLLARERLNKAWGNASEPGVQ